MTQGYDGTIRFDTKIDDSDLGPDLEKVKGRLQSAAQKMRDIMQGPVAVFHMVKQAVGALATQASALEAEWAASETAVAILNATLKATGANSWTTSKAVQEMANKFQSLTGYADDTILSMQNVLLGFKNIKGDNFEAASLQIINMAKVMRMDLSSAAQAVGKALDDPIAGIDSLTRQGFRWTEQEKELLKGMVQAGKTAEAQKIIIDALATTFGGAAEAANNTASAIKDRLNVAQGELKEEMGRFLTEALKPLRQELIEATNRLTAWFRAITENKNAPEILIKIATGLGAVTAGIAAFVLVSKSYETVNAMTKAIKALNLTLVMNPYALAAAGLAALVVSLAGYGKAQDEHTKMLGESIAKANEAKTEVNALAAEYQTLAEKVNPTVNEQNRLAEISDQLHKLYPDLTQETINLATANGTLAEKVNEAAKAQAKKNLEDYVNAKNQIILAKTSSLSAAMRLADNGQPGSGVVNRAKQDIERLKKELVELSNDIVTATSAYYQAWEKPTGTQTKTPMPGASNTGSSVSGYIPKGESQGERLKDLDTEYAARKALAERNGEDTAAIEKKWYEARNKLLADFVVEDSKKGIALGDSLASSLKDYTKEGTSELRTLGDEIVATQQKLAELKSVDIEKVLEKYAPPTSGPYSAAGYKYARQVYEQFEKGVLQSTKLSESQIKDQIDAIGAGQKYRDDRKAYFDKIALDEDTKRIAYEALADLEAEFAAKPGIKGQSGLSPENYISRDDFIEQLASQLDELQKEFTTPQYGQSGINQREGAGGASIADQIALLSEQAEQIALAELDALVAEYATKPGSIGQSGITPEGWVSGRDDFVDQLISDVIIPASLEAAQTGAMEYGKAYREGMAAWAKAKTVEDALAKMWDDVLNGLEAEYKERKPTFGQSGVIPEGIKPAPSIADQIKEMQLAEAGKQQERADIWAGSYERYLEEMSQKATLAPWQDIGIVGTKDENGEVSGGTEIGNAAAGFTPLIEVLSESLSGIMSTVTALSSVQEILNPIKTIISSMMDVLGPVINDTLEPLVGILRLVGETIGQILTPAIQLLTPVITFISDLFVKLYNGLVVPIGNAIIKAFGWIYNAIVSVMNWIIKGINAALGWLIGELNQIQKMDTSASLLQTITIGTVTDAKTSSELKDANEALKENRNLFLLASKAGDAYAEMLRKVVDKIADFYDELKNMGANITSNIIDGLTQGFAKEDFLYSMQEYITQSVIKAAVFTDAFVAEAAAIGKEIAAGIAGGFSSDKLQGLKDRLAGLYEQAASAAEVATGIVSATFGSYDVGTLNVRGDQLAKIHNKEMILEPGIAEQARSAGVFIGPVSVAGNVGRGAITPAPVQFNITATGELRVDGREIGRVAWRFADEFQGAAYGR